MLLILVVIHEMGHFFTARALGVKVLEFGVGFPPRAFGIYTGKTRVLIDPLTRFVNLQGLADLQLGQMVKVHSTEDHLSKPSWARQTCGCRYSTHSFIPSAITTI